MARSIRLPVRAIASELRRLARFHGTNVTISDNSGDTGQPGDYSLDVRLQVTTDGEWAIHHGAPDYDTDHRGAWGSDSICVEKRRDGHLYVCRFDSMAMAHTLIDQAVDFAACSPEEWGDINLYYAGSRGRAPGLDVTSTDHAKLFAWLTRNGMGVRFGSRPIGWYQQHQCAALDYIATLCKRVGADPTCVRVRGGNVEARVSVAFAPVRWVLVGTTSAVFAAADAAGR